MGCGALLRDSLLKIREEVYQIEEAIGPMHAREGEPVHKDPSVRGDLLRCLRLTREISGALARIRGVVGNTPNLDGAYASPVLVTETYVLGEALPPVEDSMLKSAVAMFLDCGTRYNKAGEPEETASPAGE